MNQNRLQNPLLLGFLIVSLLLHLTVLYLLPGWNPLPSPPAKPDRVVVKLRPPTKPLSRELDLTPNPELEKPRETHAKRLAEKNQVVEKEQAPKGDAFEDTRPDAPAPASAQPKTTIVARPAEAEKPADSKVVVERQHPGPKPTAQDQALPQSTLPDLNPQSFLNLADATKTRMDPEFHLKDRPDIEQGDAVWLDTEQDLLFSVFERLRSNIYNVWNYPGESARRGETGTCLLRFTLNREGELVGVPEVLESSGFDRLDKEAVAAVRKGSPYGPLPRTYPRDGLTIMAFFRYDLRRVGSRRPPGDIFGP